jgi:hypothetical protein
MTTAKLSRGLWRGAALLIAMNVACGGSQPALRRAETTATVVVPADKTAEDCEDAAKAPEPVVQMCTD